MSKIESNKLLTNLMLRTLVESSRIMLDSPWLMLLGFVVVVAPGGLVLMPVFAARLRRAKAAMSKRGTKLIEPVPTNHALCERNSSARSDFIEFVPSVGKVL